MLGLLLLLLPAQFAPAPDSATADTVYYGGKLVRFFARTEEVILLDSAWVQYRDMNVYADSIHYDVNTQRLSAVGNVLFSSNDNNVDGRVLKYDIDTRKGVMHTARTQVENGFFWAEEVWLVEEKVINARRGYYTTCEKIPPHYAFYCPRAKLLVDDIVIAEPVVFKAFGVPILAAPFWLVPVATQRQSGLMPFKVGNSSDQGLYAKDLAYYWVINDYADATFYCDVMTRKGVQPRMEAVYIVNPYARGSLQGSWIREWDTHRTRYSLAAEHSSRFLFGSDLSAAVDLLSDAQYVPEYGEDEIDWLKQEAFSYAELSRTIGRSDRLSLAVQREDLFSKHENHTVLPKLTARLGTRHLPFDWDLSSRLSVSHSLSNYADSTGVDTTNLDDYDGHLSGKLSSPDYELGPIGRLRVTHSAALAGGRGYDNGALDDSTIGLSNDLAVSLSQRILGAVNARQSVTATQANDLRGINDPETRYRASLSTDMALYRVFGIHSLDMHGVLHTARPRLSLDYEPEVAAREYVGTPAILSPANAHVNLTVGNGFQAKAGSTRAKIDLGNANFATSYDLKEQHLSPLRLSANFNPLRSVGGIDLRVAGQASFDFDSLSLGEDYRVSSSLGWEHLFGRASTRVPWVDTLLHPPQHDWRVRLSLNHTWQQTANMLTGTVSLYVPGWRIDLNSIGYNFTSRELTNYSFTIWKELHCWEMVANIEQLGTTWKYDFEFKIRQLPDIKFGKSTFRSFLPE